jgi:hypothetical protein
MGGGCGGFRKKSRMSALASMSWLTSRLDLEEIVTTVASAPCAGSKARLPSKR